MEIGASREGDSRDADRHRLQVPSSAVGRPNMGDLTNAFGLSRWRDDGLYIE